jgi:hypothetical protein
MVVPLEVSWQVLDMMVRERVVPDAVADAGDTKAITELVCQVCSAVDLLRDRELGTKGGLYKKHLSSVCERAGQRKMYILPYLFGVSL